jgi:hypothetical protein
MPNDNLVPGVLLCQDAASRAGMTHSAEIVVRKHRTGEAGLSSSVSLMTSVPASRTTGQLPRLPGSAPIVRTPAVAVDASKHGGI